MLRKVNTYIHYVRQSYGLGTPSQNYTTVLISPYPSVLVSFSFEIRNRKIFSSLLGSEIGV